MILSLKIWGSGSEYSALGYVFVKNRFPSISRRKNWIVHCKITVNQNLGDYFFFHLQQLAAAVFSLSFCCVVFLCFCFSPSTDWVYSAVKVHPQALLNSCAMGELYDYCI